MPFSFSKTTSPCKQVSTAGIFVICSFSKQPSFICIVMVMPSPLKNGLAETSLSSKCKSQILIENMHYRFQMISLSGQQFSLPAFHSQHQPIPASASNAAPTICEVHHDFHQSLYSF